MTKLKNKRNNNKNNSRSVFSELDPPMLEFNERVTKIFRFTGGIGSPLTITAQRLAATIGVNVAASTGMYPRYTSARLLKVELWSNSNSITSLQTISLVFVGGTYSADQTYSDSTISTARPLHLVGKPLQNTSASFFYDITDTSTVFQTNIPSGALAVMDITLELIANRVNNQFYTTTSVTNGTGQLSPDTSNLWIPTAYSQITA